jgi:flagellar basal body L-ring protein FlgH
MKKAGRDGRTAADWWHSHKANPFSRTNPFETSEQFSVPFSARVHQVLA